MSGPDLRHTLRLITLAFVSMPWSLWSQEPARIPARSPVVLFGRRVSILIAAPRALAQTSDSLSLAHALEGCPAAIRGAFAAAYANEPVGVRGASRDDRVVFVVVPASGLYNICDASAAFNPALLARGVQIVAPATEEPGSDLDIVEVSVGGRSIPVDSTVRRPVVSIVGPSTQHTNRQSQITTWISSDSLPPDAAGRLPDVTVQVSAADSSSPDVVRLSGEALRDMWHDVIVARIEKHSDARTARAPLHVPLPADKPLREAHALYSAGRVMAAARIAEARLGADDLSREDARAARMLIAGALLAYNDTSAARIILRDVVADAPCLTFSDNEIAAERLIEAMRPPARCSTVPLRRVMLASLIPGMGYAAIGHRTSAVIAAGLTSAGAVGAWTMAKSGDRAYRRYLDARTTADATSAYSDAASSRRAARVAVGYAAGAWLLAGATSVLAERAHARSIARVRDYDLRPTVGLLPDVNGGEARLAMSVTW